MINKLKHLLFNLFSKSTKRIPIYPILILDDGSSHYDKDWSIEQWYNFWEKQVISKHKQYLKRLDNARKNYKEVTGKERLY